MAAVTREPTDHPPTRCVTCRYKRPLALLGMVLTAKAWDWLRQTSATMDSTSMLYRALYAAITICTPSCPCLSPLPALHAALPGSLSHTDTVSAVTRAAKPALVFAAHWRVGLHHARFAPFVGKRNHTLRCARHRTAPQPPRVDGVC